jgi:peroxin-5
MSLATLVSGADCGPSNPLQGLAKNLDSDRGLQQVHTTLHVHFLLPFEY